MTLSCSLLGGTLVSLFWGLGVGSSYEGVEDFFGLFLMADDQAKVLSH